MNCTRLILYLAVGKSSDNEVTMIDSFFQYKDGMKGVTGSKFYFVSPDEIESRNDLDGIKSNYDYIWKEEVQNGNTELGLDGWAEQFRDSYIANGDGLFVGHDTSYLPKLDRDETFLKFASNYTGQELTDLYDSDLGTFECVGGGRCFNSNDDDLESYIDGRKIIHDLARKFEAGAIDLASIENELTLNNIPFEKEVR